MRADPSSRGSSVRHTGEEKEKLCVSNHNQLAPLISLSLPPLFFLLPPAPAMMSITTTAAAAGSPLCPAPASRRGGRRGCAVRAQAAAEGGGGSDKSVEIMRKFSEQYARRSDTFFCSDKSVTAVVIKGLADHKDTLGAPLCPCRHYDDKAAEAAQGFWNCPCVPMRERKECHCMLFLTPDNDFAGEDQVISLEEIKDATSKF